VFTSMLAHASSQRASLSKEFLRESPVPRTPPGTTPLGTPKSTPQHHAAANSIRDCERDLAVALLRLAHVTRSRARGSHELLVLEAMLEDALHLARSCGDSETEMLAANLITSNPLTPPRSTRSTPRTEGAAGANREWQAANAAVEGLQRRLATAMAEARELQDLQELGIGSRGSTPRLERDGRYSGPPAPLPTPGARPVGRIGAAHDAIPEHLKRQLSTQELVAVATDHRPRLYARPANTQRSPVGMSRGDESSSRAHGHRATWSSREANVQRGLHDEQAAARMAEFEAMMGSTRNSHFGSRRPTPPSSQRQC